MGARVGPKVRNQNGSTSGYTVFWGPAGVSLYLMSEEIFGVGVVGG